MIVDHHQGSGIIHARNPQLLHCFLHHIQSSSKINCEISKKEKKYKGSSHSHLLLAPLEAENPPLKPPKSLPPPTKPPPKNQALPPDHPPGATWKVGKGTQRRNKSTGY